MKNIFVKLILIQVLLLSSFGHASAQQVISDVRSAFLEAPDYILPALSADQKKDLVDLYEAAQKDQTVSRHVRTLFSGQAVIDTLTSDYLRCHLDDGVMVQIKLLPMINNTSLISMIATSLVEPHQSVITFYGHDWKRVESSSLIKHPQLSDYMRQPSDTTSIDLKNALISQGDLCYEAFYTPRSNDLTYQLTSFNTPWALREYPRIQTFFKAEGVRYQWTGMSFSLVQK